MALLRSILLVFLCTQAILACTSSMQGDGSCDRLCMAPGFDYDSDSNGVSDCITQCSLHCDSTVLGNSHCDPQCETWDCGWDQGDCGACAPGCSLVLLGDGVCQHACNTEVCSYDLGDCMTESTPMVHYVSASTVGSGDYSSLSAALVSLWLPYNVIYMLAGNHTLESADSTRFLSQQGLITTQITTLFCQNDGNDHSECASSRASIHLTSHFPTISITHKVTFESLIFNGTFSLVEDCTSPTCFYCPNIYLDTELNVYMNDRNEVIDLTQYASKSHCEPYHTLVFLEVSSDLTLSNVLFTSFKMQLAAIISNQCGDLQLSNVYFDDCVPSPTGLDSGLITQTCPDERAPYYCGNFSYNGGGVTRLNSGYEYRSNIVLSGFMSADGFFTFQINNVVFEFNFLPVGESANTSSSSLIVLARFRTAVISNCHFQYNIANWSCGVSIIHSFKFPLVFDESGVATEQALPHFVLENTSFVNNTATIGTVLYVHFQTSHQNIRVEKCTFINNFSTLGGLISVKNDMVLTRYAQGATADTLVRGVIVRAQYPPRYLNITHSSFTSNYCNLLLDLRNVGNLQMTNVTLYRNGESDSIDSNDYVLSTFAAQTWSYVSSVSLSRNDDFVCDGMLALDTVLSLNVFNNEFREIYCPFGSPGVIISGQTLYVTSIQTQIQSNVFRDSTGSGILRLYIVSPLQLTNLTFSNNTNFNDSSPVCLTIEMAKPTSVSFFNCSFLGNRGDSATVGRFINAKSVVFDGVKVWGNEALFTGAGILFSPYPYAPTELSIRNSEFRNNVANSFGVVAVLDFQGVLSGNPYAIVSLTISNCTFSNNTSHYQGASITLNNFINFSRNSSISNSTFLHNYSERGASVSLTYQTGSVTITNCQFQDNTSPEGGAGVFAHQYENENGQTAVYIRNCVFERNNGGAVMISGYASGSDLYSSNNSFFGNIDGAVVASLGYFYDEMSRYSGNRGGYGPAISAQSSSIITISDGLFTNNSATRSGGALYVRSQSRAVFLRVQILGNLAVESGGGIYCDSSDIVELRSCVIDGNQASDKAGAVYSYVGKIALYESFVRGNIAGSYASIILIEASATIQHTQISSNYAPDRTSGILMSSSSLFISSSQFTDQTSFNGGFILGMNNNNITITNSSFHKGTALHHGGAVYVSLNTVVTISKVNFTECTAVVNGGALLVSDSVFTGTELRVSGGAAENGGGIQTAESSVSIRKCVFSDYTGGAIQADNMVAVDISECLFERSGSMAYRGAALYFTDNAEVNVTNCRFTENSSRRGGAVYFVGTGVTAVNGVYALKNNEFTGNLGYSGGAFESDGVDLTLESNQFANNTSATNSGSFALTNGNGGAGVIRCEAPPKCSVKVSKNEFRHNTAAQSGGAIQWLETVPVFTDNTYESNLAIYGPDIASYPIILAPVSDSWSLLPYEDNSTVPIALTLPSFISGQEYQQTIRLGLFDHQSQRISTKNNSMAEILSSDKVAVAGQIKTICSQGIYELTGFTLTAQPGTTQLVSVTTNGIDMTLAVANYDSSRFINTVALKVVFRLCESGESLQENACVICPKETYSLDPAEPCKTCPTVAVCYGGFVMVPKAGYWRARNDTDTFFECLNTEACTGSQEPPDVSLTGQCAQGYTGNLCQVCLPEYSRTGRNSCSLCPSKTSNISVSVLIILIALCGIALVVAFAIRGATRPRSLMAIYFKIFLNYLQMVVVAASLNLNWPSFAKTFLSGQEMAGGMADQLFSFECLLKGVTITEQTGMFTSKLLIGAMLPLALAIIAVIAWLFYRLIRHIDMLIPKIVTSFVIILFIIHPSITKMMFSVYSCMQILPNEYWLVADLAEKCWTSSHTKMILLISVPSLGVWVLGLPTVVLILLIRTRHRLSDLACSLRYSFLYKGYEPRWFFWEFVILYRKVTIVCSSVFLSVISIKVQSLTVLAVLLLAVYLQLRYQPFNDITLNKLEVKSILVSAVTIYAGLYYDTNSISKLHLDREVNILLFIVIIVVNGYFLFTWVLYISPVLLNALRDNWRRLTKRRPNYRVQNFGTSLAELKEGEKSEISSSSIVVPSATPLEGTQSHYILNEAMAAPDNTPQLLPREYTDPEDPSREQHFSLR